MSLAAVPAGYGQQGTAGNRRTAGQKPGNARGKGVCVLVGADGGQIAVSLLAFALTAAALVAAMIALGSLTSVRREERDKETPYECGMDPIGDISQSRFSVNYYPFAVAFLLFEVEVVFLLPWALVFFDAGWGAYVAAAAFLGILLFGLWYAFRSGGLSWD